MVNDSDTLLIVWREACRHVEIAEALPECAATLFADWPADVVLVRRLEVARESVETVAVGLCRPGSVVPEQRTDCRPAQFERLLSWCRRGEVALVTAENALRELPGAVPAGLTGEILIGPLIVPSGPIGLVLLAIRSPNHFEESQRARFGQLLEPFTVWLENDRRLRELRLLREAAEADKRLLLSRLGRQDISEMILGAETGLRAVMQRVALVARTDAPVLILGETGSGKEVVARAIHERSRRATGPFLRVNCGAIPGELVDSELFGHERGSFTGAVGERKGWFERADGGTLFLDECGELPPAAQVRLLRILQDGTFERMGGERSVTVDTRVIAATHRDLQGMVAGGTFRQDLWYRLAVFPLELPPLRHRLEDIPAMAAHFAARAADRSGVLPVFPSPEDIGLLVSYSWPGNVRELRTVMERAVILGDGKHLEVAKALGATPVERPATTDEHRSSTAENSGDTFITLDEAMARHIETALARTRGRIEGPHGAARLLGINPHTLRARMRKLELDWNRFRAGDGH